MINVEEIDIKIIHNIIIYWFFSFVLLFMEVWFEIWSAQYLPTLDISIPIYFKNNMYISCMFECSFFIPIFKVSRRPSHPLLKLFTMSLIKYNSQSNILNKWLYIINVYFNFLVFVLPLILRCLPNIFISYVFYYSYRL